MPGKTPRTPSKKAKASPSPCPSPTPPAKSGDAGECAALDAQKNACRARVVEGSPWCARHNDERVKLYVNYKARHAALAAFPEDTVSTDVCAIRTCQSLATARQWQAGLLKKYQLLTRCINARAYFTERFFGNDMDFGHKSFWKSLCKERDEIEAYMYEIEQRAFQLILTAQKALWVLERQQQTNQETVCGADEDKDFPVPPKTDRAKARKPEVLDMEDPLDVALRVKCEQLWVKIKTLLAVWCAPLGSRHYKERVEVLWACLRRAVYVDTALMVLAQNYSDVQSLLNDATLSVADVDKLWTALLRLSYEDTYAAIDDVVRPDREGDSILVLGGKVYKDRSETLWPLHAYGHFVAIRPCYSCLRRVCKTVEDAIGLTRFVIFQKDRIKQTEPIYDHGVPGMSTLQICGFIPDLVADVDRRSIVRCACERLHGAHWRETKRVIPLCAGMSLKDPRTQPFVNACMRHDDFIVMIRRGATARIIRSDDMIASRVREGVTRMDMQQIPWKEAAPGSEFGNSILEEAQPLRRVGYDEDEDDDRIQDCFQVVILDDSECNLEEFVRKLLGLMRKVYDVATDEELVSAVWEPFLTSGDLEITPKPSPQNSNEYVPVPNTEKDVMKSYAALWGGDPLEGVLPTEQLFKP